MVAIVAGNGLGLLNTSLNILGEAGVLGQSVLGQGSSRAFVNAVSGNLVLQMQDEQLAGRGLDLYALRTSNSLGTLNDGDGDGWRWGYELTVQFQGLGTPAQPQAGATVIRTDGDGHETTYTWNAARAAFIGTEGSGAHDELRYDSVPGEWVWTDGATRMMERYSNSTASSMAGRLIRRTDTSNNSIVLMYDGARLTLIQDTASQQELRLKYGLFNGLTRLQRLETRALIEDANGRATATLGSALRQVEYNYDSLGRLTTITTDLTPADGSIADGVVFVTNYTYDNTTARIASVTQSDGTSVFFTYDAAGRVSTVKDHSGATSSQLVFTYSTATNSTAITDGNGQVWTYRYDATTQQLKEILTPTVGGAALSTKFTYDASGNLVSLTDARNNTVTYGYDSNGNRTLERDALGNTVTRTFSTLNQMLTETRYRTADPDGAGAQSASDPLTTRYVYDENSRLRFIVSAEGRVTENRYGTASVGYGLLTHTLQYIGQVYDLTGLSPAAPLTEAQLTAWVAGLQDKTQVQLTEYSYDLRGNMSQQTSYAAVSATGTGVLDGQASVTEYIYDAHSQLRQRIAVRGSARDQRNVITSFAYDGMGRVLTSTDANGTQTTVYDGSNRRITMTAASGLTETRSYDSRGRLVSVGQTGDGTTRQTRYVYNNADQLRMVEDAQGGRRYRFYDAAGRLEYSVDATGAVTRFEYNATGQLVRQTQYLNHADASSWYDSATQTVTKLSLTVGGASSDVPTDVTHDRVTTFGYDAAGRLTTSTDAANTVTTTRYDGVSRVMMTQTGDRVTRYLYDKDNRKVGSVDALGYLTEYKYDAGGRLIETVRYSQRSPAAANLAAPVWIGVSNQNAIAGQPFEYRVPAYDADGDPLTFSVVGTPPSWLSFDAGTATLRGTPPATVTSYNVTLRADDGRGKTSDVTVLIAVTNSAPSGGQGGAAPTWVSLPPLDVVTNTPVSYVVPAATGQSLTYRLVSGMPPGLSFNATTRTITGSSSAVGFYTIVLRATNASGQSVDRTVSAQIRTTATTPDQLAGSDQLASWRPTDPSALRTYVYYDGQGRAVGAVDEQQFLTETVYDDALNTQRTLCYLKAVTVTPSDTLASLKSRAGGSRQTSFVRYDSFGRVRESTGLDGSTVTRNEYDEAGRLTRIVSAAHTAEQRARRTFYNAFGEVIATLGGEGDAWLGTNPTPQRISEAIRDYGIRHEYDTLGRVIRSVDANGNKTLFYYDRENRLTHTINVIGQRANNTLAGEVSETKYNSFGQIESVRRYAARLADPDMDQLLASGGGGFADESLLSKLAALANTSLDQVSSYEYDRSGRVVKEVDGEHGVTINIYNAHGELAAQVRSHQEGRSTTKQFDYDLNGRVVSQTDDVGGINSNTRTAYDAFGRVIQSIDGAGKVTTTAYQDSGRTIVVTDPLNRTTRTEYDALGRVLRVTNALNQQTVYAYNEAARSATVTTPEKVQVTTVRTRHDETLSVTDGRGNATQYAYNKDGQQTTVTDPLGQVVASTTYDRSGRKLEVTDARGTVTRFGYDQRNRVVERRVDPNGLNLTTLFEFDALGQQIQVTEGANTGAARVTTYAYDRKNQLTQVIVDPNGLKLSTRYTFDGIGNTVKVEQGTTSSPSQRVTLAEFDQLGRRVKEIVAPSAVFGPGSPDTRDLTTEHRYDAAGRLSCTIHPDGTSTWYVYDAADQQIQTINAMGEVSESVYDANGRVVQSRRYFNRLSAEDLAKLGDAISAPVTPQVHTKDQRSYFVYDNDGRQRYTLQANIRTSWTIAENRFDANGNIVETRRYDKFLPEARLNAIDTSTSPGISVAEIQAELITLGYSDADSALAKTQRTRFAYDANNRLRFTVDALGSVSESVYDAAGQQVSSVRYATRPMLTAITESAINAALNHANTSNQVSHYAYDAAGRRRYSVLVLASDATGTPTQQLVSEQAYDSLGRVVQTIAYATLLGPVADYQAATLASAITAGAQDRRSASVYDAAGRKVYSVQVQTSGSQNIVSKHAFDPLDRLVESTSFAKTMALADFGKATLDSATITNASAQDRTTRFVYDAVGRQRFVVGADGALSETVYDALGRIKESRQFDLLLSNTIPRTEDALSEQRASRAVGDGITRGEKYTYDLAGRLLTTTDAAAFTETNEYNALGDKTSFIDKNGAKSRYAYDRQGRLFDQFSPPVLVQLSNETAPTSRSLQTRLYHDAFGSLVKRIEATQTVDQRITKYAYDRLGRQITMVQPGWYDPATGRVEASLAAGRFQRSLATTYDALGNAVRIGNRTGVDTFEHTYRTYNSQGQIVHEVNALNNVTRYTYTAFGEQETVTRYSVTISGAPANGMHWTAAEVDPQLNWGHDENGNLLPDAFARTITMAYDQLGRKIVVTPPTATYHSTHTPGDASQANYFRPNAPGHVPGVQDAAVTRYEYNAFGDLTLQRLRINNIVEWQDTSFTYDARGRRTRSVDAAGYVTNMVYDAVGNLVRTEELTGHFDGTARITGFAYNALDQQTRVDRFGLRYTDANGVDHGAVYWTWEDGGSWVDPDADVATTVKTTTYDGYGRVLSVTDGAGNVTSLRYNARGQLFQVTESMRLVAPITANGGGSVDAFRNQVTESPVKSITLDAFGRAVRLVRATSQSQDARETLQTYDAGGNLTSTTDPEGNVKLRYYDHAGRVIKEAQAINADLGPLGINQQGLERRYAYDALGQLIDTLDVYLDGTDLMQSGQSVVYNTFGEVVYERRKWGLANQSLAALNCATVARYAYDNAGHVFEKVAADGLTVYHYNLQGQVTREDKRGNTLANQPAGNLPRITETQYDVLGRAIMIRRPAFDADITAGTGTTTRLVTPYSRRTLDRWGNLSNYEEGGYEFINGQPVYAPNRLFRTYGYDDNNQLITESLGTHGYVSSSGVSTSAQISRLLFRDLQGNVVKEVDEAREPQTEALISSRTRHKQYNSVGQLTAEIDATERKLEYAYNIHGDRLATRNARGTVFFEFYDRNGSVRFHGVLRTSSEAGFGEYNSFAGTGTIFHTYLHEYLYDQANRRFASKTFAFTEIANAPWTYTWLDGRNFGVIHRDVMGVVTQCRYDQFGNKAVEIDGAERRKEWNATTEEFVVGRIETYTQPTDTGTKFGRYTYNRLGELAVDALGNARTEYDHHKNGLVHKVTIVPDTTAPSVREITTYFYDARGQLTSDVRIDSDSDPGSSSLHSRNLSYDNQGRLVRVDDSTAPFKPSSEVYYSYDEWGNVRRVRADYMPTWAEGPRTSDSWNLYDDAGRMTLSNGTMSPEGISLKPRTPGSVRIAYDNVGRRNGMTEHVRWNSTFNPAFTRTWDTVRDERYEYNDLGHLRKIEQRIRHINIVRNVNGSEDPVNEADRVGTWRPLSSRSTNLRGDVTRAEQWSRISGTHNDLSVDMLAAHLNTTTSVYRADGKLAATDTVADNPIYSTSTRNAYAALTGLLDSYEFTGHRSDETPFTTTVSYQYTFQNGSRVARRISDSSNGLVTTKTYDQVGRLSDERVELPNPNGGGSDRFEERRYEHSADGSIIFKDTELRLSSNGPDTEPLLNPSTGQLVYVGTGNRTIAMVGGNRLALATKFDFTYTPMSEAATSGTSQYVVRNGDTLLDIAQAIYGDGALWYLIANANSIVAAPEDPLPASEVGKAYEIPSALRSTNSASTFAPYNAMDIIGNDRPLVIPPPPPPKHSELDQILISAVLIPVQFGVPIVLSALGVPVPLSAALGAGLSNLAGQGTSWLLGMRAPGHQGIDWADVGNAAVAGALFSPGGVPAVAGSLGVPAVIGSGSYVLGREVWQQGKKDFEGWTSGPGLNWSGIGRSLFNVGFDVGSDALSPVLGGPSFGHFTFSLAGLINSAYNPSSGWAIPGSGRSPTVGAFGYAYSAVASGLANMGYNWIRDELERPSPTATAASARSMQAKFEGAGTGSHVDPSTGQEVPVLTLSSAVKQVVVDGRRYWADVDPLTGELAVVIDGRRYVSMVDPSTGQQLPFQPAESLYDPSYFTLVTGARSDADAPGHHSRTQVVEREQFIESFRTALGMAEAQKTAEAAAAALVRDHGRRLKELQQIIDHPELAPAPYVRPVSVSLGESLVDAAKKEQQRLIDAYAPPQSCVAPIPAPVNPGALPPLPPTPANSAALPALPSIPWVYLDPRSVLTQAEVYSYPRPLAANMIPQRPQPFGRWGYTNFQELSLRSSVEHAYAYEGRVTGILATNDLDRLGRAGYERIFVGTGVHGDAMGNLEPHAGFVPMMETAAADVVQRHPGLEIKVLNLADQDERRLFWGLQAAAAKRAPYANMNAGSFATLAHPCYSACRLPQGAPGEPTPTYFVTSDPEFRTVVHVPEGAASTHYALAGVNIASGALNIYSGIRHDNDALAALGIAGGTAQVAGGASWIYGVSRQSVTAISFGSKASLLGGYVTAPLTLYDVYHSVGAPGEHASRSWQENAYTGIVNVGKLAGIFYPKAALAAIGAEYVVKPFAEKVSEYATPKFIGAMSQAYGIPQQYLWAWH